MADDLTTPPRNELAFWLAQKLRSADPSTLERASPVLGSLARGVKGAMLDPVARGLESWAYGDRFFGPPANAPLVNERTMDMTSALPLGAATGAVSKMAPMAAALYAGSKRPELMLSHSVEPRNLLTNNGDLPKELYNTSFGIKNNALMTEFGPVALIPHLGKLDPKNSPSTLHAMDAFTPRWGAAAGKRVDDVFDEMSIPAELLGDPAAIQRHVREQANARLADRLVATFRGGGAGSEASGVTSRTLGLPEYGQGGFRIGGEKMIWERGNPDSLQVRAMSLGPRFQSFRAYEDAPLGAGRLDNSNPHNAVYQRIADLLRNEPDLRAQFRVPPHELISGNDLASSPTIASFLKAARSGRPGIPQDIVSEVRDITKDLKSTQSEYGELKNWGPLQLTPENFAGMIVDPTVTSSRFIETLRKGAQRRGIPFAEQAVGNEHYMPGDVTAVDTAQAMQNGTFKPYVPPEPKVKNLEQAYEILKAKGILP